MSRNIRRLPAFISWMQPETDESILQRYVARRDETAFSILVKRYARLIYSVCAKQLNNLNDVEDACQATLLILAQRASSIRQQDSLRSWLHGVAIRVSKSMNRRRVRLARRERDCAREPVLASPTLLLSDIELQDLLRAEVERMPDHYRMPLQLCYWQGQSRDEMAETLGWSRGQVKGQLERAKKRLKSRLRQRGIQFLLPLGMGLTTVGLISALPAVVMATTSASTAANSLTGIFALANVFYRVFQASKGLGTIALIALALGWGPPMPFLPIFPEQPEGVQQLPVQSPELDQDCDESENCGLDETK